MKGFFLHIAQVAGLLGLAAGIVVFSLLLYASDFGQHSAAVAEVAAPQLNDTAAVKASPDSRPVSLRWVHWVFGAPTAETPSQSQ